MVFTVCITNEGSVYSFGDNEFGQLGQGNDNKLCLSPQLISDFNGVEFIQCGGNHTICKINSNEYYSCGSNKYGQLGQGYGYTKCNKPAKCLNWPEDIIDIKCDSDRVLLLTSKGCVYSFGSNYYCFGSGGQLGLDANIVDTNIPTLITEIPLIKRIECGYYHSMCIDINDKMWVFGDNSFGQLGLGDKNGRCLPTLNEALYDIIDISSGKVNHTFVKTIDNEIYAFGSNYFSQLGIETSEKDQLSPIQIFKDKEDIWTTNEFKSTQKSARK